MKYLASTDERGLRIGYAHRGYNERRNIFGSKIEGVSFVRRRDALRYPEHILFRTTKKVPSILHNTQAISFGCDLVHLFNGINIGRSPWITSFETALPSWGSTLKFERIGINLLASNRCKKLLAMSKCATEIQQSQLERFGNVGEQIFDKTEVLHPPQAVNLDLISQGNSYSSNDRPLTFSFVGSDFFRKGGMEILNVFDNLFSEGANIRLEIVSNLQHGDYATKSTAADSDRARNLINKWAGKIVHYEKLQNSEVLALFARSDVGLLPTWADTYGYSVLEARASGCPMITTNIRAMPEINDDESGWIISVPKRKNGEGIYDTPDARKNMSKAIEAGLRTTIENIQRHPDSIKRKRESAIMAIRLRHDPSRHAEKLKEIYLTHST